MLTKLGVSEFDAHYVHSSDIRLSLELMNAIEKYFRVALLIGDDISHDQMPEISLLCRDLIGLGCRQFDIAGNFSSAVEDTADLIFVEKLSFAIDGSAGEITTTSVPTVPECLLMSSDNRLGDFYLHADKGLIVISLGESSYSEDALVSLMRRVDDPEDKAPVGDFRRSRYRFGAIFRIYSQLVLVGSRTPAMPTVNPSSGSHFMAFRTLVIALSTMWIPDAPAHFDRPWQRGLHVHRR